MMYALSVVIPVYNEADNVDLLSQEIINALSPEKFHYEIIFVDDCSTDNTAEILKKTSRQNPQIKYVLHKKNYGQSAALISGAKEAQHPWIVTMDGDGQNDPKDIPLLFDKLNHANEFSVIFGNRKKRNDDWIRKLSSRIGNGFRQLLLKDNCPDTGCSLKLFPRDIFLELPRFNHLHRYLPALFKRAGFEIINVPVNHRARIHGESKYGVSNRLWTGIVDIAGVMWLIRRPCQPKIKPSN